MLSLISVSADLNKSLLLIHVLCIFMITLKSYWTKLDGWSVPTPHPDTSLLYFCSEQQMTNVLYQRELLTIILWKHFPSYLAVFSIMFLFCVLLKCLNHSVNECQKMGWGRKSGTNNDWWLLYVRIVRTACERGYNVRR